MGESIGNKRVFFQNSIILKGYERLFFLKGCGFMMFHNEIVSAIVGRGGVR